MARRPSGARQPTPSAAGLGLPLLLIYTLGFTFLAALVFERKDL